MKNILACLALLLIIGCAKDEEKANPFLIQKNQVGKLTPEMEVRQLDSIFSEDSVVTQPAGRFRSNRQIMVYDKSGKELLALEPVQDFDSTSTIASVQVKDPRFKTDKGFGKASTFKDISTNYKISRIENTLSSIIIFIDEINVYVAIDKSNIEGNAKFNTNITIEPTQIPDDAKIKNFWIGWE